MKATPADKPFDDNDWLYELKLDGYRIEAVVDGPRVKLWTRNKQDAVRYFPDLASARPTWINAKSAIVDGEVVALDENGQPQFSLLQDRAGMGHFGSAARRRASRSSSRPSSTTSSTCSTSTAGRCSTSRSRSARSCCAASCGRTTRCAMELTSMAAWSSSRSSRSRVSRAWSPSCVTAATSPGKRSRSWLKVKIRREQEVVVVGYEPGQGTHADIGSLILAVYEGKELHYAARSAAASTPRCAPS